MRRALAPCLRRWRFPLHAARRSMPPLPGSHLCLIRGATMIPQAVFDVGRTLRIIEREKVTVLPGPPTIYASIIDHPAASDADLSSLRLAVTGAATVPARLIERIRESLFREVIIAYGLSESCGTVTIGEPNGDPALVGKPIDGTEVTVAADTGEV